MAKQVAIIGAGIGGLATALRLLDEGYDVTIYEKEERVGGKVNQLKTSEGYVFDTTASILLLPQSFFELFNDLNLNLLDYVEFDHIQPTYRVFYDDDVIDFHTDLVRLVPMLEEKFGHDASGYLNWLQDVYQKYLLVNESFLRKSFNEGSEFFNLNTLWNVFKASPFKHTDDYISHYVKNEKLRNYLCFQTMYIGMNPFESSNVYTLLPGVTQLYGLHFIKGGMYRFVEILEQLIKDKGGVIKVNHPVSKIVVKNQIANGIVVNQEALNYDLIVANADVPYVKTALLQEKNNESYALSCSTFILYLGIKKKLEHLNLHNIYIGPDFKENISAPFNGQLPTQPSLYIYVPSKIDKELAPVGCECLNVTIRVPNLSYDTIEWDASTINTLKLTIYGILNRILRVDDITALIEFESYLTPHDLEKRYHAYKGCAFGLNHNLLQTNYFRPHQQSENIKGLYFVGASTQPGTGISLVLNSAKLVTELIMSHKD